MDFNIFLERFKLDPNNFKPGAELIEHEKGFIYYCEQETSHINCPKCGNNKTHIHGYFQRKIRCSSNSHIDDTIIVKRPRYICYNCKATFTKPLTGIQDCKRLSDLNTKMIYLEFYKNETFKQIAETYHITTRDAIYKFDEFFPVVSRDKLPSFLCIDEFHFSRMKDEKYCCVLSDFATGKVIDILQSREKDYLIEYFKKIPEKELKNVKVFISDMYKTYRYIRNRFFKNATHVIDRFHIVKQLNEPVNSLRVIVMKNCFDEKDIHYKFMKKQWRQFLRPRKDVPKYIFKCNNGKEQMYYDDLIFECKRAHLVFWEAHEILQDLYQYKDYDTFEEALNFIEFIAERLDNTRDYKLMKCAQTFRNWKTGIANAICKNKYGLNFHNGVAEGNNNLIKTILKNAYGYQNFERFRKRALLILRQTKLR